MASKDVELVIRAKDQTKGALASVTEALDRFTAASAGAAGKTKGTEAALADLGGTLKALQVALGGASLTAKISSEMNSATEAVSRLEGRAQDAVDAIQDAAEASQRFAEDVRKNTAAFDRETRAVESNLRILERRKQVLADVDKGLARAARDRKDLAAKDASLTDSLAAQAGAVARVAAAYEALRQKIAATEDEKAKAKLERSLAPAERRVAAAQAGLDDQLATQVQVRTALESLSRVESRLQEERRIAQIDLLDRQESLTAALARQEATTRRLAEAQASLRSSERSAGASVQTESRARAETERANAALEELRDAAGRAEAALAAVSAEARKTLLRAFGEQRTRVLDLQAAYKSASEEATRLAGQLRTATGPTEALQSAFDSAKNASARARNEFESQRAALTSLRGALRESGSDLDELRSRQARVSDVVAEAGRAYRTFGQESELAQRAEAARQESFRAAAAARAAQETATAARELKARLAAESAAIDAQITLEETAEEKKAAARKLAADQKREADAEAAKAAEESAKKAQDQQERDAAASLAQARKAAEARLQLVRQFGAQRAGADELSARAASRSPELFREALVTAQKDRLRELRREVELLTTQAAQLGRTFAQTEEPSEQLTRAFTSSREAAARARNEYRSQIGDLAALQARLARSQAPNSAPDVRRVLEAGRKSYEEYTAAAAKSRSDVAALNKRIADDAQKAADLRAEAAEAAAEAEAAAQAKATEAQIVREEQSEERKAAIRAAAAEASRKAQEEEEARQDKAAKAREDAAQKAIAAARRAAEERRKILEDFSVAPAAKDPLAQDRLARDPQLFDAAVVESQKRKIESLRQEVSKLSAEAAALGRTLATTTEPSEALQRAFAATQTAAANARREYRSQIDDLGKLQTSFARTRLLGAESETRTILSDSRKSFDQYATSAKTAAAAAAAANERLQRSADAARKAQGGLTGTANGTAAALARAGGATSLLARAFEAVNGDTRQALGLFQRLRGEALSLAASFGGVFAAVEGVKGVVTAFQTFEAAQSRLLAVFDGNATAAANELDFVRRNAERLGIDVGTLAQEYSKFAVATKGTNLQGEETRKIFTAIAEAARVNRATLPELQGTFLALTQIVSKGTVSMEELKQQLAERLPGALQLMAEAAGKSVPELVKLIEAGDLSSDTLSDFADVLNDRFGAQLPDTLAGVTAEIGRFQDAVQQAFLRVANGGFIESFSNLLNDLNEGLRSAQFQSFLDNLSVGLATLADSVGFAVRNADLFASAVAGIIGLKIAPYFVAAVAALRQFSLSAALASVKFSALQTTLVRSTATLTATQVALNGAAVAIRGLLSATGIGLLVIAISAGLALWATQTDKATEALVQHRALMDDVRNAYDKAGDSVDAWRGKLEKLTRVRADANLAALRDVLESVTDEFDSFVQAGAFALRDSDIGTEYVKAVIALREEFESGKKDAATFRKELDSLSTRYKAAAPVVNELAERLDDVAARIEDQSKAVQQGEDQLIALTGTTEEAAEALKRLSGATEQAAQSQQKLAERVAKGQAALNALKALVPSLAKELEALNEKAKLKDALKAALDLAQTYGQVAQALELYKQGLRELDNKELLSSFQGLSGSVEATAKLLKEFEGVGGSQPALESYFDVNAFRIGFGSDTVTLSDGTIKAVTEGMRISVEDANRDLARRVTEFQVKVQGQVGAERFDSFSAPQQAVLTSIAYNYGSLPDRILDAVRTGTSEEIATAIRGLQNDAPIRENGVPVNRDRRLREAGIFEAAGDPGFSAYAKAEEERARLRKQAEEESARAAERAAEDAAKQAEATKGTIAQNDFELQQQARINEGRERQAKIEEAIRDARRENPSITQDEIDRISEQTAKLFDAEAQQKRAQDAAKQASATQGTIDDNQFEIAQQELLLAGKERQAAIERAIRDARSENAAISAAEIAVITEQTGRLFDQQKQLENIKTAKEQAEEAEARVNDLLTLRQQLNEELEVQTKRGASPEVTAGLKTALGGVNAQLQEAIANAIKLFEALGSSDPAVAAVISKLRTLSLTSAQTASGVSLDWDQVKQSFASGVVSAFDNFFEGLKEGKTITESLRDAFLQFASDFLKQIANMILQQLALNAISAVFGAFGGAGSSGASGVAALIAHDGNVVGRPGVKRQVNPALFAGARRYHAGGLPGLKANEVPAILERGEEVLTRADPRNILNGGAGGDSGGRANDMSVRIVNAFDGNSFLRQALDSKEGRRTLLNFMSANRGAINATGKAR